MAYALVGSVGTVTQGTTSSTPSFAQATSAGNLLICWANCGNTGTALTTTSSGWLRATSNVVFNDYPAVFYKPNSGAGESAPTITGGTGITVWAALAEFSGGATSSPVDQVGSVQGATSPLVAAAASADVAAGQLMVTAGGWNHSKSATVTTADTYNNGATPSGNLNNDASSVADHYRFAYGITTGNSAADQTSQSDNSMNITGGNVVIATFKLASAATLLAQPCLFASSGMLAQALGEAHRIAGSWRNRRRSGILVPDLWLPGPIAVPAAV